MIASDSHSNYSRQNDPAIQALFTAAYANPATLEKSLADIEQKLVQDSASVVPTYIETSNVLYGSKVGGVQADGGYGTTSPINAYIKK
jgi:ABC-type oligopeptide transport system substrate-binding subunit